MLNYLKDISPLLFYELLINKKNYNKIKEEIDIDNIYNITVVIDNNLKDNEIYLLDKEGMKCKLMI